MKYQIGMIIFIIITLLGCERRNSISLDYNSKVREAIVLQNSIFNDPLFYKILRELEEEENVNWQKGATRNVKEDLTKYKNKTEWLIDMYQSNGGYDESSVTLWKKRNPWSSTTAVTIPCVKKTKLNTRKLNRDKYSILNTLIHERVHSFCLIHPISQSKEVNQCDPSYLAGDLAEAIILFRNNIKKRNMNDPVCPALLNKIKKYKLLEEVN